MSTTTPRVEPPPRVIRYQGEWVVFQISIISYIEVYRRHPID